ncbi:E3 ubiquitin-protein ligase listerin-like [Frieseomelitta varia]|uniref:E3 ubiquitin-protein ligase listerin-like n=1 Tax=Frieseomelitta varia TaxID=561572 RepID=UPI001CB67A4B|nr:E3 ubiquitin-protein ligase listerin-like [Frieseomelitta varia]
MCANANEDLLHIDNVFTNLLNNISRLLPMELLRDNINKDVKSVELFSTEPSLNFSECWTEWRLDHIVCWMYTKSLRYLPMLVRQWWSTAGSKVSVAIDKITTHYISPMLRREELLKNKLHDIENIQVKVHPAFREVIASYQIGDTKLELNIMLSPNHLLEPTTVECEQYAGGANLRNCHIQLSVFPAHQNKSIYSGLVSRKRSLDKKIRWCIGMLHMS